MAHSTTFIVVKSLRVALLVSFAGLQLSAGEIAWIRPGFSGGASGHVVHDQLLFVGPRLYGAVQVWDLDSKQFVQTLHSDELGKVETLSGNHLITRTRSGFEVRPVRTAGLWRVPPVTQPGADAVVGFQQASNRLAVLGSEGRVHYWDLASEAYLPEATYVGLHARAVPSPNGLVAAVVTNGMVTLYSLASRTQVVLGPAPALEVGVTAFSRDGASLAVSSGWSSSGDPNRSIFVYDVAAREHLHSLEAPAGELTSIAFSSDANLLAAYTQLGNIAVWDARTGTEVKTFNVPQEGYDEGIAFAQDGSFLVAGAKMVRFLDGVVHPLSDAYYTIDAMAFSPDGSLFATQNRGFAHIADAKTGRTLRRLLVPEQLRAASTPGPGETLGYSSIMRGHRPLLFTENGRTVIVGNAVFDVESREFKRFLPAVEPYLGSPTDLSSEWFTVTGYGEDVAQLRNYADGSLIRRLRSDVSGGARAVATSPSGKLIATSGGYFRRTDYVDSSVKIWNSQTAELITTLSNRTYTPFRLVFSANEKLVAVGADLNNPEVNVWEIASGKQLLGLRDRVAPAVGFDILPDSRTVVYGIINRLEFWDAPTGRLLSTITNEASFISAVAASPDGKTVLAGRMDGTVVAYNVQTPPLLTIKSASSGGITLEVHGPTGRMMVVEASPDLQTWAVLEANARSGEEIVVPRPFTREQFFRARVVN